MKGAVHVTRVEVCRIALEMGEEEQAEFKAFLVALLENGDTALPPASDHLECV